MLLMCTTSESETLGPVFGKLTLLLSPELFFEPAATRAGQGQEKTGQVGSGKDSDPETWPRLTLSSPRGAQARVMCTAWLRNSSSRNIT